MLRDMRACTSWTRDMDGAYFTSKTILYNSSSEDGSTAEGLRIKGNPVGRHKITS